MTARYDGLANCVTGLGDAEMDTRQNTYRTVRGQRSVEELEAEWRQSWMAHREVSQLAWDMWREGFAITDLEPADFDLGSTMSFVEGDLTVRPGGRLENIKGLLHAGWKLTEDGDKLGGAVLFPILADGMDPSQPLDLRRIRRVIGWEVLDRKEITPWLTGTRVDPEFYMLTGLTSEVIRPGEVIHASRLIVNKGRELSRREERNRQHWGASRLDLNWRQRRGSEEAAEYLNTFMDRASWLHYSFGGLDETLSIESEGNPNLGREIVAAKMREFRRMARTLGIMVTDGGQPSGAETRDGQVMLQRNADKVESIAESAGDLPAIVQSNRDGWQMGSGMPRSIAFGEAPAGLRGGDNSGDWQSWQGVVRAQQKARATPWMSWMLTILWASKEGPTGGLIPKSFGLRWHPLIVPSPVELAEIGKTRAETDAIRISSNVVEPAEVRDQRLVVGDVDGDLRVAAPEELDDDPSADEPKLEEAKVGIAKAVLEGGQAVADGTITEEFYASYLTSIDADRYPPAAAARMAATAAGRKIGDDGEPVPPPVEEETDAEEVDEVVEAFAKIPKDLMSAKKIAETIREELGHEDVSTRTITKLIEKHAVPVHRAAGKVGYSFREIQRILAEDNGTMPAPVVDDDAV